ncbi:ATPase family AAA domain-containing protein 5 [Bombus pascuorum]|uniref:ATPase family AAA domain-containing protein 5 n=1 Tax=Bombus pascuorum TaxID=65598 RepID=UPI002130C623|nr:ATPase family AAA domain-containing protein 5 [Bombus pascuorum]XP_060815269.1 ATPase family AAA domain-containing protein 5 [Bombus pascuorum]
MRNITQYFEDNVQSNNDISLHSDNDTKKETKYRKDSKGKRNRVKIKISRTNSNGRICDIMDNSSDMIDKTPSPFAKINNEDKDSYETPKKSFPKSVRKPSKLNKSTDQASSYLNLGTNDFDIKNREQSKEGNVKTRSSSNKKYRKELSNKTNISEDISMDSTLKSREVIDDIEVVTIDSNNEIENSREESNAFQILMNRNKVLQYVSPIKVLPQNEEVNSRKSEEYREKLKRSKEKLIALADKKGYSKRKLAEMEEGEKIEQIIQNRIKLLKGEERKDSNTSTTILNHKQSGGSLLNYFSKIPMDLVHTNVSTIVVKADVHMTENNARCELYKSDISSTIQSNKKTNKLELSQMDDIRIIESENINILNNKKKQQNEQNHKHRWSLRIKLQTYENENAPAGDTSDEELFSPRSKVKLDMKNYKKCGSTRNLDSENLSTKNRNVKGISKPANEYTKLKLEKREHSESSKNNSKCLNNKSENKQKFIKCDKHDSTLIKNSNVKNYSNTNLEYTTENKQSEEDCMIIKDNSLKRKTFDKLAPLFTKRKRPNPEIIAARRLFLQPDMTDNNSKNKNRKVNVRSILPFPLISHVTQLNNLSWHETNIFNIPKEICNNYVPIIDINDFKSLIDFSKKKLRALEKINKPKIQEVLTDIEKHCSNVKDMWDVISLIVKEQPNKIVSPKTKTKKNKQSGKKEVIEYKTKEDQFEYCSWTYKYRPKCSQQIVGNEEAVAKLREWLLGWKLMFTNEDVSSGDEFYSSDSCQTRISENNQVAVLLGPHGCGKTASVYALADEFGYTVLELNASSRRTGKKLLKELEEATKSHRIKKDEKTSAFCDLVSNEIMPKKIPQNSLILLEDVDIIFEEDEGFISATYQLASNSKRPIVMTCRDVCSHLNKMAPQQNRIYFQEPVGNRVCVLLELISLAETGYRLPSNCITELLQSGDLRKAILQLQYLLLSGPPRILEQTINFKNSFWQNIRYYIHKPAIKITKRGKRKRVASNEVTNDDKNTLNNIANKLDNIALLSSLIEIEDCALNLWQIKAQPNLSLVENTAPYSASSNICLEIAEWIGSKIICKEELNDYNGTQYQDNIMLKKQSNKGVNEVLSQTTSLLLDHQIIATDYLPSVRTICRAEALRANNNNKRRNRFFHYLHNLKAPSTLFQPNILAAACKIMHDKVDNNTQSENNSVLV